MDPEHIDRSFAQLSETPQQKYQRIVEALKAEQYAPEVARQAIYNGSRNLVNPCELENHMLEGHVGTAYQTVADALKDINNFDRTTKETPQAVANNLVASLIVQGFIIDHSRTQG